MEKISSGIEGFDQLLYGGFPKGRAYLVSGEPGTGKTIFSLQFLIEGIRRGETALYISIDEKPEHILLDAEELGWPIKDYLDQGKLHILDATSYFGTSKIGDYEGINIDKIIGDMIGLVDKLGVTRLAVDPIAPLIFTDRIVPDVVEYIRRLIFAIEERSNCTTLLTSYIPVGSEKVSHHGIEEFAASGIILLKLVKANNKYIRSVRLRKVRGTRIDLSEYSFEILPDRGVVLRQPI